MNLRFDTHIPLNKICETFNRHFPGLKLDFVFHGDEGLNFSSRFNHSFLFAQVDELCSDCNTETIVIDDGMTIKEAEDLFFTYWHLPATVYTNINGYWQKNIHTACCRLKDFAGHSVKN